MSPRRTLKRSATPLIEGYDCLMLDLDGVVYIGPEAVDGVPDLLGRAREAGVALAFVTNNAARTPESVAEHLRELGVEADPTDVVTSAQAAATLVADRVPAGSAVLVVGGKGLEVALRERGLVPVSSLADGPAAVVQGFHPTVGWKLLAEAAYAVASGLPWIASNLDLTVPTARGIAPGNGALVRAVATAVGREPDAVAGKPFRPLFDETVHRVASERPLVIGDRLDTDIEGAVTCGADSLLVLTGVTDLSAAAKAPERQRPDFVSTTMAGLFTPHDAPSADGTAFTLAGWKAEVDGGSVSITARGDDPDDGVRAVLAAAWAFVDAGGSTDDLVLDDAVSAVGGEP